MFTAVLFTLNPHKLLQFVLPCSYIFRLLNFPNNYCWLLYHNYSEMESVGKLEEEALKRKERLKNLKRKQEFANGESDQKAEVVPK